MKTFSRIAAALVAAVFFFVSTPAAFAAETTLTVAQIAPTGLVQTLAAANTDGSQLRVPTGERTFIIVTNGGGGSINVTLEVQTTSIRVPGAGSVTIADQVVAVANGTTRLIGPIAPAYVDATGYAHITYSGVTSVTVQAYTLPGIN